MDQGVKIIQQLNEWFSQPYYDLFPKLGKLWCQLGRCLKGNRTVRYQVSYARSDSRRDQCCKFVRQNSPRGTGPRSVTKKSRYSATPTWRCLSAGTIVTTLAKTQLNVAQHKQNTKR